MFPLVISGLPAVLSTVPPAPVSPPMRFLPFPAAGLRLILAAAVAVATFSLAFPGDARAQTCNSNSQCVGGAVCSGTSFVAGVCCMPETFQGRDYLFCYGTGNTKTWSNAVTACRASGYDLVSVGSATEQDYLRGRTQAYSTALAWWIGFTDQSVENSFTWSGADQASNTYTSWNTGEPNDAGGNEDCVTMLSNDAQGRWNDENCTSVRNFVCEKMHTFVRHNGRPFAMFHPSSRTWSAARTVCQAMGNNWDLTTVRNATENENLRGSLAAISTSTPWWIGLTDAAVEGTFTWANGSAVTYTNWSPGEPNNYGSIEDCGNFNASSGKWNDASCGDGRPFVCARACSCDVVSDCCDGCFVKTGACDDGNACTDDACSGGVCVGTNDNTNTCSDGNACTQTDACVNGSCVGSNAVVCTAASQCHEVGTCNTSTGVCSNPFRSMGTPCNDGDGCTWGDSCNGAGTCMSGAAVTCNDDNPCTDDTCNSATGCVYTNNNANTCSDGNACTQTDTCVNGSCVGSNPVVCTAASQCHEVGTCNTSTGACSNPFRDMGFPCNDGDGCTWGDSCNGFGTCMSGAPVDCDDGDACITGEACVNGSCVAGTPVNCDDGIGCTDDSCNSATGCVHVNTSTNSCTDGDACTTNSCSWFSASTADFVSISSTGTAQTASNMDDGSVGPLSFGFTFPIRQNNYTQFHISTNGRITFASGSDSTINSCPLSNNPVAQVSPFWDDLDLRASAQPSGRVYGMWTQSGGTAPNRYMIVEWSGRLYDGAGPSLDPADEEPVQFQAILFESGRVEFRYGIMYSSMTVVVGTAEGSATVGLSSGDANGAYMWNCVGSSRQYTSQVPSDTVLVYQPGVATCAATAVPASACNDGNACTDDNCESPTGCVHTNNNANTCSDGNPCTQTDFCLNGTCMGSNPVVCTASSQCHDPGVCNPATGACSNPGADAGTPCDDGDICTLNDACDGAGECVGQAMVCETIPCMLPGVCQADTGTCAYSGYDNGATCEDGEPCTVGDTCLEGECLAGGPNACDDGNGCTDDSCSPGVGCVYASTGTNSCDDGDACTTNTCSWFTTSTGTFTSIATTGTSRTASNMDDGSVGPISLGFTFALWSTSFTQIYISTNGRITFLTGSSSTAGSCPVSSQSVPQVSPFWDDLDLRTTSQPSGRTYGMWTQSGGTAPNRYMIVEWSGRLYDGGSPGTASANEEPVQFQAVLYESGAVEFRYGTMYTSVNGSQTGSGSALIGITDGTAAGAFQWGCTTTRQSTSQAPTGTVASFANGVATCMASPSSGNACDDGVICTTATCVEGECVGAPTVCPAPAECREIGVCNPDTDQCEYAFQANGNPCTDGNVCTDNHCEDGDCVGVPNDANACTDENECTDDSCQDGTCVSVSNDANTCTADDGKPCTDAVCQAGACVHMNNDSNACGDGKLCTSGQCCVATAINGRDFLFCPDTQLNWQDARDLCLTRGLDLPSIRSAPENAAMFTATTGLQSLNDWWMGYTDMAEEGVWVWLDGSTTMFTNWSTSEPNNSGGNEDCAEFARGNGRWNDIPCETLNYAACADNAVATELCWGVTCTALDQCHVAGECDPASGVCSNPAKPDGTACDDGNLCATNDACQAGVCSPGPDIVNCVASDSCHTALCDALTGECYESAHEIGSVCNDGNACTTDTCEGEAHRFVTGGTAFSTIIGDGGTYRSVTTGDLDDGFSGPVNIGFLFPFMGTVYSQLFISTDGRITFGVGSRTFTNVCPQSNSTDKQISPYWDDLDVDSVDDGMWTKGGGESPQRSFTVEWRAHLRNTTNLVAMQVVLFESGTVEFRYGTMASAANGSSATIGVSHGTADTTLAYSCNSSAISSGLVFTYEPATATCQTVPLDNGTACDDNNPCSQTDICHNGFCAGGNPIICMEGDCYEASVCDPATGTCLQPPKADGTPCNDGDLCTTDACENGVCVGTPLNCDDGIDCTTDACSAGSCTHTANHAVCNDSNPCTDDSCDAGVGCVNAANTAACDDGLSCTTGDTCMGGACSGTLAANTCFIDGGCYSQLSRRSSTADGSDDYCQRCVTTSSVTAWTADPGRRCLSHSTAPKHCNNAGTCQARYTTTTTLITDTMRDIPLLWQRNPPTIPANCTGTSTLPCTWTEASAYCDNLEQDGISHWRLPTVDELRTLLRGCPATEEGGTCPITDGAKTTDYTAAACGGCTNNGGPDGNRYLPEGLFTGISTFYGIWSSSVASNDDGKAFRIWPYIASVSFGDKTTRSSVICVAEPEWTVSTQWVRDGKNGTTWQNNPPSVPSGCTGTNAAIPCTYDEAAAYCAGLTINGWDDWGLPTIDQLRTLAQGCAASITGGSCTATGTYSTPVSGCTTCTWGQGPATSGWYVVPGQFTFSHQSWWSSSAPSNNATLAARYWPPNGQISISSRNTTTFGGVLCVRGAETPRFTASTTTTVDSTTGLRWTKAPPSIPSGCTGTSSAPCTWSEAAAYCASFSGDGHSGFRLPTVAEMRAIIDGCPATMTGGACTMTDGTTTSGVSNCGGCASTAARYLPGGVFTLGTWSSLWTSGVASNNSAQAARNWPYIGALSYGTKTSFGGVICVK